MREATGDFSASLGLPAMNQVGASLAAQADEEGWPAGCFLAGLAEHEIDEHSRHRRGHHLAEARLDLDTFDFQSVPVVSKTQSHGTCRRDAWLNNDAS
jgi:hypothetical protein